MRSLHNTALDWNDSLWKYFFASRFISAIENNRLYFSSANQFSDPFEGAVAVQMITAPVDPRYPDMEDGERAFFELKRLTKINCWHRSSYESDAMWKLYAGEGKGIAICSTPERMRAAFTPFRLRHDYGVEDLWGGAVQYIDLTQVRMRDAGMLERFFFKHRAFEWEREFRLAISLRTAEEFAVQVPADGIEVEVDFNTLIERIVIGPFIAPEERNAIFAWATQAGFDDRLYPSSLLGRPRYV